MRYWSLVALAFAAFAASDAWADTRIYWDDAQQQWVVGDDKSSAFKRISRDKIPREMVDIDRSYAPGAIIVDTAARRLYYVLSYGRAIQYAIGVGREGFEWSGSDIITNKAEWPTWKPPKEMIAREKAKGHILEEEMPGGLDNPLGARALYIGFSFYRIHGTNDPRSVGHAVSSGCIRLTNEDITDLYDRARLGARVTVLLKTPKDLLVKQEVVAAAPVAVPKPRLNPLTRLARVESATGPSKKPALLKKIVSVVKSTGSEPAEPAAEDDATSGATTELETTEVAAVRRAADAPGPAAMDLGSAASSTMGDTADLLSRFVKGSGGSTVGAIPLTPASH